MLPTPPAHSPLSSVPVPLSPLPSCPRLLLAGLRRAWIWGGCLEEDNFLSGNPSLSGARGGKDSLSVYTFRPACGWTGRDKCHGLSPPSLRAPAGIRPPPCLFFTLPKVTTPSWAPQGDTPELDQSPEPLPSPGKAKASEREPGGVTKGAGQPLGSPAMGQMETWLKVLLAPGAGIGAQRRWHRTWLWVHGFLLLKKGCVFRSIAWAFSLPRSLSLSFVFLWCWGLNSGPTP
jgi:hypothetical protein